MKARTADEHDSTRRFKTTVLSEMRGKRKFKNVVIVAITNKGNQLDENFIQFVHILKFFILVNFYLVNNFSLILRRRFEYRFVLKPPDAGERKQLFEKFFDDWQPALIVNRCSLNWKNIIERTTGFVL